MHAPNRINRPTLLLAGIAVLALIPATAQAQTTPCSTPPPQCVPTPLALYPNYADSTSGWSPNDTVNQTQDKIVIGDIDGDGNDELVALNTLGNGSVRVEAWHWSSTVWAPMSAFPSQSDIAGAVPTQVRLADIDGGGQKDVVIHLRLPSNYGVDLERIYKYAPSGTSNVANTNYTLLTSYYVDKLAGPSYWFQGSPRSAQEYQLQILPSDGFTYVNLSQFQNGRFVMLPGSGEILTTANIGNCAAGKCIAFSDLNGDGVTDIVYLATNGNIYFNLSIPQGALFGGPPKASAVVAQTVGGALTPSETASWQMGDIDGDGQNEMFFQVGIFSTPISFYYFDRNASDFVPYPSTSVISQASSLALPDTVRVVPHTVQGLHGVAEISIEGGSQLLQFQSDGTRRNTIGGTPLENSFSQYGELTAIGYSGYLSFAVESGGTVLAVRGPNGFLDKVENRTTSGPPFVNANTYTTNGYPSYQTTDLQTAYRDVSNLATGNANPNIRSLYPCATGTFSQYASVLTSHEDLTGNPPPAPSNVTSQADYDLVYLQTVAELQALDQVTTFFGGNQGTAKILQGAYDSNTTYLGLVTSALSIPPQPDIASESFNILTAALNGLGSLGSTASAFLQLAATTKEAGEISNEINAAGSTFYLLGTITGDTSTYASDTPPNPATGEYDLLTILDNFSVGAIKANTCHQYATQTSWDQAEPLYQGLQTGLFSLNDVSTADQVDQQMFQLTVWQTLAPTYWSIAPAQGSLLNPLTALHPYLGNPNTYPGAYIPQGTCNGDNGVPVGLVFAQGGSFPSLTALDLFFQAPPNGLGALPSSVLFDNGNWDFSPISGYDAFLLGFNDSLSVQNCNWIGPPSPEYASESSSQAQTIRAALTTPAVATSVKAQTISLAVSPGSSSPPNPNAIMQTVQNLSQQVPQAITTDETLRSRLSTDLIVAYNRLLRASQFQQPTTGALLQLNDAITRLQIHAQMSPPPPDMPAASQALAQIVAVKNLLLGVCEAGTSGCSTTPGQ